MNKVSVVIVSPALADANNGNWQTAQRWQQMLAPNYRTRIVRDWPDADTAQDSVMIALHARRSAAPIAAWAAAHPGRGLVVVLTGTDLYRDIHTDALAQQSAGAGAAPGRACRKKGRTNCRRRCAARPA